MEASCPIIIRGSSTGWPPIQVSTIIVEIKAQNKVLVIGRKAIVRCREVWRLGIRKRTKIENRRAKTPPSLLGMERRMA